MTSVMSKDGTEIAFSQIGEGLPVIYVSGATMYREIHEGSRQVAELLADSFSVLTYDRRGRGESGDVKPYAVEREIEDLDALIRYVGGSAYVFGESSGAVLALRAAEQDLPITKLALYEPPFIIDDSKEPLPEDFAPRFDKLVAEGKRADAFEMFMTIAVGLPAEMAAGIRHDPLWPALEKVTHTIAYDREVMGDTQEGRPETLARFASITAPTLVMAGGESPQSQHNAVKALASVLPNSQLLTLPGETHQVSPAGLAPVVREFFRS